MNWTEIKEKYPKTYKVFEDWVNKEFTAIYGSRTNAFFNDLNIDHRIISGILYAFFDEHYIPIGMTIKYNAGGGVADHHGTIHCQAITGGPIRKEVEIGLFTKAFSVLETQSS